jgi:phage/plasmid primase-like uncharacterized protein
MLRHPVLFSVLLLWPTLVQAQDPPIAVYFEPIKGAEFTRLNNAIQDALSQPPLRLETRPGPQTVIVAVPDKVDVQHKKVSGTFYAFTVSFSRDGHSLGESQQNCGLETLSECSDQIVLDVKSAAAPR